MEAHQLQYLCWIINHSHLHFHIQLELDILFFANTLGVFIIIPFIKCALFLYYEKMNLALIFLIDNNNFSVGKALGIIYQPY